VPADTTSGISTGDIAHDRLRTELDNAKSFASLGLHLSMGMRAVIDLLREREKAHVTLGETERAAALAAAIAAADAKEKGIHAEYVGHSKRAEEIEARIAKENPL
jgi:hypothetical protein